ncbi:hypothetical protein [Dermatobacter hominis]|uniref:hypothetical protein n=1 Tax=Dermatobacter hominis TaxID=2884263 RepID=UPI001D1073CE|nr:hypothetical protein [Dermatobacter hominis]UDY34301.1 hypothetical protein LH044_13245 [Dermatobacter hominis]
MELALFEAVAEGCRSLVPSDLGELRVRPRSYGLKAWIGPAEPPRAHYEAQVVSPKLVPGAEHLAVEVGFHLEHRSTEENDAVLAELVRQERSWRAVLGDEAVAGPFLGRPEDWRRVSEVWLDPDLGDPDLAMDLALTLTDYICALEPLLGRRRS